ncbi:hypothetical protein ACIXO6_09410 [Bacteroides fragilis]
MYLPENTPPPLSLLYVRTAQLPDLQNKRKEIRRYSLSYAHSQIFGVPANSPVLDDITVKDLKKKKQLTDKELDGLIQYFKERKENMAKKYGEEKIAMEGQSYYYIASELLP